MLNIIVIRKFVTVILAIIFIIWGFNIIVKNQKIVKAFGPLKVTYPSEPMFSDSNIYPGKTIIRSMTVENTDNITHDIGMMINNFINQNNLSLSDVIDVRITRDGLPIYGIDSPTGKKSLTNFASEELVRLNRLRASEKSVYDFTLQLDNTAGDDYQGKGITLDLATGIESTKFVVVPTILPMPTMRRIPTVPTFPTFSPLKNNFKSTR